MNSIPMRRNRCHHKMSLIGPLLLLPLALSIMSAQSLAVASENPKQRLSHIRNESKNEPRGTDDFPLVVRAAKKTDDEAKVEEAERYEKSTNDRWLVYSTIWLSVVTTALALFTYRLWSATRRLVVGAEDTARRQLRAYMSLVQPKISGVLDESPLRSELFARNTGQTPAYNFGWVSGITMKDLPFDDELRVNMDNPQINDITVGASTDIGHTAPSPGNIRILTVEEREDIRAGRKAIIIYGEMKYLDTFQLTPDVNSGHEALSHAASCLV